MTLVPHVTVLPLPVLRAVVAVFSCSSITRETISSLILTSMVTFVTSFPLTVSAGGPVRNESLSYITIILARTSRHGCAPLSGYCLYLGTGNVVSVYKIVRYSSS